MLSAAQAALPPAVPVSPPALAVVPVLAEVAGR